MDHSLSDYTNEEGKKKEKRNQRLNTAQTGELSTRKLLIPPWGKASCTPRPPRREQTLPKQARHHIPHPKLQRSHGAVS